MLNIDKVKADFAKATTAEIAAKRIVADEKFYYSPDGTRFDSSEEAEKYEMDWLESESDMGNFSYYIKPVASNSDITSFLYAIGPGSSFKVKTLIKYKKTWIQGGLDEVGLWVEMPEEYMKSSIKDGLDSPNFSYIDNDSFVNDFPFEIINRLWLTFYDVTGKVIDDLSVERLSPTGDGVGNYKEINCGIAARLTRESVCMKYNLPDGHEVFLYSPINGVISIVSADNASFATSEMPISGNMSFVKPETFINNFPSELLVRNSLDVVPISSIAKLLD